MKAIIQWVLRTMMKDQTGIVRTMPKKDLVDFNVAMTAERLMRNGIDPNSLKNANQVENAINQIEAPKNVQQGIKSTKSADIFELQMPPKKIDPKKGIMGGKQIPDDDLPPPGSRGGPDDIAAPVQSSEETIKNMIEAENKKNIAKIKNRKMVKDAIDNVSPGFVRGDRKYNAQLVAEDLAQKKFGKEFYDLDQRQQMDLYGEALDGLSKDFADGGRAGFDNGGASGPGAPSIKLNPKERPMGPGFETDDPKEAAKEVIRRLIRVEGAKIPLTRKGLLSLNIDSLDKQSLGGIIDLLGGELQFGVGRDKEGKGAGFTFKKRFADGGRAGFADGTFGLDVLKLEDKALNRALNAFKYYQSTGGKKNFKDYIKESGRFGDQFRAEGGRIGYKDGPDKPGRRKFMKIMGGLATIPFIGKFFKGAKTAAPAVEKAVETVTEAPSYFFDLVAKIKLLGEPKRTPSYRERVKEYQYTGKDGNEYLLTEELDTGDIMIQKDKIGGRSFEEGSYDVIEDRTEMIFRKGQADEATKGKPADEYEEYKVEFDQDGTAADASQIDEISKKEIIEEVTEDAPSIKKAGGGIARMLGE